MSPQSATAEVFDTGENFEDLFETYVKEREKSEGEIVKGVVVALEKDLAVVDVGAKSEGRIALKEFGDKANELKVGDVVEVYLERFDGNNGECVLSREKALREEAWQRLEKLCEEGSRVDGVIFGKVKGGFTVDLNGAVAFLPGSQVDIRPVRDVTPLIGITQPFQILKMDRRRGNIVVSRRAVLEESRSEERDKLLSEIHEGQILDGIVKNITDYGAFIDLGGVDGLLHVTDISWKRINHPSEVLTLGQTVQVKVTKYDADSRRVSLGMKQLENDPWKGAEGRFAVGSEHIGRVSNITDYGAFIELETGIEGLVHVSEMSWTKKNVHPGKIVSTSQEVKVQVLNIDPDRHRISLGMKQCEKNPWQAFADNHKVGDKVKGEIRNITEFGMFIGLDNDIDGLVHASDLSWDQDPEAALAEYKKGQEVEAKILSCDAEKERISLGIKQLSGDPMEGAYEGIKKGSVVTCTVEEVESEGIHVSVADGLKAFIKRGDLSKDRQEQRSERFAKGDRVDAKVTQMDKASRKISLSIKALEVDQHKQAVAEYGSTDSGASLGDILGAALDQAKEKQDKK